MARDVRDILYRFLGDAKSLDRATKTSEKGMGRMRKSFGKVERAVGGLGVALGAREIAQWIVDAAEMGSQARQAAESADKVLGPAMDDLRDRFEESRRIMGFNSAEFDTTVAKLGLLTEGYNLADDAQAEVIGRMFDMAGELAAFRGDVGLTAEAVDAMTAAVRGEFDPLEQWGVKLKQADISARRDEILLANEALSEEEATLLAIIELIEERGEAAVGSFAEAQDTLAGATTDANKALEDMQIEIGKNLEEPMLRATEKVLQAAEGLNTLVTAGGDVGDMFDGLVDIFDSLADNIIVSIGSIREEVDIWNERLTNLRENVSDIWEALKRFADNPFRNWKLPSLSNLRNLVPGLPKFHSGGVVPGRAGQEVPAMLEAGETVLPRGARMAPSGGSSIVINVQVAPFTSPDDTARALVDLLQTYNRNSGPIAIETRSNV